MSAQWAEWVINTMGDEPEGLPPGTGPTQKFDGPWFSTQLTLSLVIGISSFLTFCAVRTKWDLVYMGRTKLKDFSPTSAHSPDALNGSSFFGWILPTWRTSEFTVLQTVGLDAAVLLNFYKMAFMLFSLLAFLAAVVLMPLNFFRHGSTDIDDGIPPNSTLPSNFTDFPIFLKSNSTIPRHNGTSSPTMYDVLLDPQTSATVNLLFTYTVTALVLYFLHRNFQRFVLSRQAFSLQLIHSVAARTVLVSNLPSHLRGDKVLADYFEACHWSVESVSVCREVEPLRKLLKKRTNALLKLEAAWTDWVGNPAKGVTGYDPDVYARRNKIARSLTASPQPQEEPLIPGLDGDGDGDEEPSRQQSTLSTTSSTTTIDASGSTSRDPEEGTADDHCHVHTTRPKPTMRPRTFGAKVDAVEYWEKQFEKTDEQVKQLRRKGKFDATHVAFVTFEKVADAQMACQVVHYPHHAECITEPAPEPRDVVWSSISMTQREGRVRQLLGMAVMVILLLFWIPPVSFLATLLSYREIQRVLPWLAKLIDKNERLAALVQNTFPSLAVITFNGLLPFFLSWLSFEQGHRSNSAAEYSLLRKYHLMLLVTVLFIFLLATTFWALFRDLANSPAKIPEKLARALLGSNVRNFMISYVMLQSLGLMPSQLLNMGPVFTLGWSRITRCKTPRDYAESNAPPMLNYGWVYPQALLVFTLTLVFCVVSPLILVFGALYFGAAYIVYKYKLLFIYFKPYESNGEAWQLAFTRMLWALLIFQVFMTGLFSLRQPYWPSLAMLPLIAYTLWWAWHTHNDFDPLSRFLALSSICEVTRGGDADEVVGVRDEGQVTRSQANLNHRRYAVNDETLYVAPSDKRTDYSQPPMSSFYYGVLNTGRRRYAHPALSGVLPFPWLPAKARPRAFGDGASERRGVVLSLRRKVAKKLKSSQNDNTANGEESVSGMPVGWATGADEDRLPPNRQNTSGEGGMTGSQMSSSSNPWRDPTPPRESGANKLSRKVSYDPASGVIAMPDEGNVWGDEEYSDGDGDASPGGGTPTSPSTYFHHPERRRTISGNETLLNGGNAPGASHAQVP